MKNKTIQIRLARLRAMSPIETMYRIIKTLQVRWDKWRTVYGHQKDDTKDFLASDFIKDKHPENETDIKHSQHSETWQQGLLDQFRTRSVFLWQGDSPKKFHTKLMSEFPSKCEAILSRANEILEHRFQLFWQTFKFDDKINWHKDLLSGRQLPCNFWSDINFWDRNVISEVKYTWELNRHQHFVTLAQAYFISSEKKYADELVKQWSDWIEKNPPKFGINWTSSLEMALRLVSWTWALQITKNCPSLSSDMYVRIIKSIDAHARFIERHLSRFSSANNHLIGEGLGLINAGTYFPELRNSKRWRKLGFDIVFREIPKQVYEDGVSKEQAIYYQRYIFDFGMLTLLAAKHANIEVPILFQNRLEKMAEFILNLLDCEGNIPRIGDEDGGQAVCLSIGSPDERTTRKDSYRSLLRSAALLFSRGDFKQSADGFDDRNLWLFGIDGARRFSEIDTVIDSLASKSYPLGGYHILRSSDKTGERIMTFDTGPLGYGSLAAHGHADALSITLNCYGESVLVDSGTFLYLGAGSWRDYFRSTSAHNTVAIDDLNQSEIRGPFQWGRKARARLLDYREDRNFAYLEGSVHGFYQGRSDVLHNRRIAFLKPEVWIIRDVLYGKGYHSFALHFHLGSCYKFDQMDKQIRCRFNKSELSIKLLDGDNLKMEILTAQENPPLGWCSTAFGHKEPCTVVRITGQRQLPCSVTTMLHSRPKEL